MKEEVDKSNLRPVVQLSPDRPYPVVIDQTSKVDLTYYAADIRWHAGKLPEILLYDWDEDGQIYLDSTRDRFEMIGWVPIVEISGTWTSPVP